MHKKASLTILISTCATILFNGYSSQDTLALPQQKKKILVLTSDGGYGHRAASATLKTVLSMYNVTVVNVCDELLQPIDPIRNLTFGSWNYGYFYDKMLQNGWIRSLNFFARYSGPRLFNNNRKKIQELILELIKKETPDLLISVFSFINYSAYGATQDAKIPFLCMTLDADMALWLPNFEKCKIYKNFTLTVGTLTPKIKQQLIAKGIPNHVVREVGIPLRHDFLESKNKQEILREWNIPNNKPVVMMIRGGSGSNQLLEYVYALQKSKTPLHILACVGKNQLLAEKLSHIKLAAHISLSVIPFTTRISDLMFVSDVLIASPSPTTCNEALHFGIPILLDFAVPTLFWERATLDIIAMYGTGEVFKCTKELPSLVEKYLQHSRIVMPSYLARPTFEVTMQRLVAEILSNKSAE